MPITVSAFHLAYSPLPKAGCSSVKQLLAQIDPDVAVPSAELRGFRRWHDLYPTLRYHKHRWRAVAGYHRFCVIRDPMKRLMSVYTNRVVQLRDLHSSAGLKRPEYQDLPRDPDPDTFFLNLERYKAAASVIKHHILPAELFLGPDLGRYDAIYQTEDLPKLAQDLSIKTGRRAVLSHENKSRAKLRFHDLSAAARDAIRPRLEREYLYFKDFFDNPFS